METLIINKRHEMPKSKRVLWDIITVLLWAGWLYLWKPIIKRIYAIFTVKSSTNDISDAILNNINSVSLIKAILLLTITPIVLFMLSRIGRHQMPSVHLLYDNADYADYFHLDTKNLIQSIQSHLITVYHDDNGNITNIENKIELPQ